MTLNDLNPGEVALVNSIEKDKGVIEAGLKTRIEAMGFTANKPVCVIRSAAWGGPLQVRVGSTTEIAIRRSEAQLIKVVALGKR